MKNDTLQTILNLKASAIEPKPLPLEDPLFFHFVVDGKVAKAQRPIPKRDHEVETLGDLAALARRFHGEGASPVVWYSAEAVTLVIDDSGYRVDKVSLLLETSDVFRVIELLAGDRKRQFATKEFVRLLRIELAGTLDPGILLNRVRKTNFISDVSRKTEVMRDRESMGVSTTSSLGGDSTPPEFVTLLAPVYKTPGETEIYGVRCAVEVLTDESTFQLIPFPDEVKRVRQLAVDSIFERLALMLPIGGASDDSAVSPIPCYQGKP